MNINKYICTLKIIFIQTCPMNKFCYLINSFKIIIIIYKFKYICMSNKLLIFLCIANKKSKVKNNESKGQIYLKNYK